MRFFIAAIIFLMTLEALAQAPFKFGPQSVQDKQNKRYQNIWTLSDWMEQQRRVRLMDQWLALNSSYNPFEFFIGGDYTEYESTDKVGTQESRPETFESSRGYLGAYASIIGLQGLYMQSEDDFFQYEGSIHLRLLGRGIQNTNLTGFYGVRYRVFDQKNFTPAREEKFRNTFAGGNLTLYITKYFGIEGVYKHYFEDESDFRNKLEGYRYEGTFFIDFAFIRPFGTYFKEVETYKTSTTETETTREGIMGGLKIFF